MTRSPQTTAALIRAAFPEPARPTQCAGSYCVLGAAALFAGHSDTRFPTAGQGAELLQRLNPRLTWTSAMSFSFDVSATSDEGRFNDAWRLLDSAVRYGQEEA